MKILVFNKYIFVNLLIYFLLIQLLFFILFYAFLSFNFTSLFFYFAGIIFLFAYCIISYVLIPINIIVILLEMLLKKSHYFVGSNGIYVMGWRLIIIYLVAAISFLTSLWVTYDLVRPLSNTEIEEMRYD